MLNTLFVTTIFTLFLLTPSSLAAYRRLLGNSFAGPGNASYEYIVVGGGNAGLPLAVRLAEAGKRVAVIEAGSFYEIGNSNYSQIPFLAPAFTGKDINSVSPQVDWQIQTVVQKGLTGQSTLYPRGKTLGGCSARNYNAYHRGTKGSYQMWADEVGDPSYEWDRILPYFEKSISFTPPADTRFPNATPKYDLGTLGNCTGPVSVTYGAYAWAFGTWAKRALASVGIPEINGLTSGNLLGSSNQLLTIGADTMVRDSSETSFLRKLGLKNPNLIVYPNTLATRVLFDNNKRAVGIEIDFGGRNYILNATAEVILSAGAFLSPQLLMVSGVGPANILQKYGIEVIADRPGVGQNLTDHTLGGPTYRLNLVTSDNFAQPDFVAMATEEYNSYPPRGPYASLNGDLLAFEKLPTEYLDTLSNTTVADLSTLPSDWPHVEYLVVSSYTGPAIDYLGAGPGGYNYGTIQVALVAPFSRGSVNIQSDDMHDKPLVDPAWLTDSRDQEIAVAGYRRVRELFDTDAMKPVLIGPEVYPGRNVSSYSAILRQIRNDFGAVYHASCTCRMGKTEDPSAVVDSKARVIGVKGLRVVDTSSFALLPPGHPMATVYMFAEKIADEIIKGN
ncbi:hypothetical protein Plec18170_004596 [Paecilomyces lecythidis]